MKDKVVPVLVAGLIFFAFFSGSLWTKVKTIEKQADKANQEEQVPQQQPQAPEEPQVLGVEDQAEITDNALAVKGPENAKVTIVEFSEYQCPFCKKYIDDAYVQIMANYGDQVRYIFRDYPLPFHQHAQLAAEAARCAGDQGNYWPYHDKLFADQATWSEQTDAKQTFIDYSLELGLNQSQFADCLESGEFTKAVKDDFSLGQKMGVQGTPSFFINGQKLVGAQPYAAFEALIKEELEK